jgi:hypothetical protein
MRLALHEGIMKPQSHRLSRSALKLLAVLCAVLIGPGDAFVYAAYARPAKAQAQSAAQDSAPQIPTDQLDSLVAPIALFPDPLLAQTLAASTYPLELMQLQQWLGRNPGLNEKALADAVAKQPWDPSVQSMAVLPDLVKRLTDDIQWTTDLGNAFLAQQSGVMNAVQRMRQKAQAKGSLKSSEQQVVQTETVDNHQVIVIEQANPQVVYVPSYNPEVVYGAPLYPYPSIYYPSAGYYAAGAAISFGVGVAMGAFWGGGGWGWNTGWGGGGSINVNNFNNFNRAANINRAGNINRTGAWQHNAAHRGGAPYRDRATANRYGGAARGDSLANRQGAARQQINRQGGQLGTGGVNRGSLGDRGGVGNRGTGGVGDRGGLGDRGSSGIGGGVGNRPGGGLGDRGSSGIGNRPGAGGGGINRPSTLPSGGADRIGSRDLSRGGGSQGAFGSGGSRGFDGAGARANSSRGSSSFGSGSRGGGFSGGGGSRGGGGFSRGGGGSRGGGSRGGGGGRRR